MVHDMERLRHGDIFFCKTHKPEACSLHPTDTDTELPGRWPTQHPRLSIWQDQDCRVRGQSH